MFFSLPIHKLFQEGAYGRLTRFRGFKRSLRDSNTMVDIFARGPHSDPCSSASDEYRLGVSGPGSPFEWRPSFPYVPAERPRDSGVRRQR